jgi:hypothetical protein
MELYVVEKRDWDELKNDIKEIKNALVSQNKISAPKKWMSTAEAAKFINCAERTVYLYCSKGLLKPKKFAGKLMFEFEQIENLINNG